ncbi:MAG: DUF3168 domain-containing protein [Bacillota bacterium]
MAETVTPRQAVYAHLKGDLDVAALVGGRVYHQTAPDDATYPLIVLNTISNVDRRDLAGVAYVETRLQVTAMAATLAEAEAIALAVRASLEGFRGLMAGALEVIECRTIGYLPIYQEDVGQTHYHVDILVTHDA